MVVIPPASICGAEKPIHFVNKRLSPSKCGERRDFIQFLFTQRLTKKLALVGENKELDGTNSEGVVFQVGRGGEHSFLKRTPTADQQEDEPSVRKPAIICFVNLSMLPFNLEVRFS